MVNQHHKVDISHQRGYALSSVALSALLVSSCHQIQLLLSLALPALFREDPLAYDDLQHPTPLLRVSVTMYETKKITNFEHTQTSVHRLTKSPFISGLPSTQGRISAQ